MNHADRLGNRVRWYERTFKVIFEERPHLEFIAVTATRAGKVVCVRTGARLVDAYTRTLQFLDQTTC